MRVNLLAVCVLVREAFGLNSGADTYASSSGLAKGIVGGLTSLVNSVAPTRQADNSLPRLRAFKSLSMDQVVEGLRTDIFEKQYLWSGEINPELYSDSCVFTDPTLSFEGLSTFERNLENLDPLLTRFVPPNKRRVSLVDLKEGEGFVEARWRMVGDIQLPWAPRLELDGTTRYAVDPRDGRIARYDESWENLSAVGALASLLRKGDKAAGAVLRPPALKRNEEFPAVVEHWPGRLEGAPPPAPGTSINARVVVLPGFGNAAVDYVAPLSQPEEVGLKACLERRGMTVDVLSVERTDWIKVFSRGLTDRTFLRGSADWDTKAYDWYLDRARDLVASSKPSSRDSSSPPLVLVAHSAGGWLARALFRRYPELEDDVAAVVTLGSPHYPPRNFECATRGVLSALQRADVERGPPKTKFVTVGGDAVDATDPFTIDSYTRVSGQGSKFICGDGVVPLNAAHTDFSAAKLTLNAVLHSINQPNTNKPTDAWYGAESRVDDWLPVLKTVLSKQL